MESVLAGDFSRWGTDLSNKYVHACMHAARQGHKSIDTPTPGQANSQVPQSAAQLQHVLAFESTCLLNQVVEQHQRRVPQHDRSGVEPGAADLRLSMSAKTSAFAGGAALLTGMSDNDATLAAARANTQPSAAHEGGGVLVSAKAACVG
eukprot:365053-Chlamydomonas_euryale.AAC.22